MAGAEMAGAEMAGFEVIRPDGGGRQLGGGLAGSADAGLDGLRLDPPVPDRPGTGGPGTGGPAPGNRRPPSRGRPAGERRRSSTPSRQVTIRAIAVLCTLGVVIAIGVTGIGSAGPSVTTAVTAFLLDWEGRDYPAAAALTTGNPTAVVNSLRAAYSQLGAADLGLSLGPVVVSGDQAYASFGASIDLGRGGLSWQYQGHFAVRRTAAGWRVVWSPAVIVPGLGPGDRLAVLTTVPSRALLLDSQGRSLIRPSSTIELGVVPDRVRHPARTADELARVTGLAAPDADEMIGQILAWPPRSFLELVQLSPAQYQRIKPALDKIQGLERRDFVKRLFVSTVPAITGQVGTETAKKLIDEGEPYLPGTTVGLSGLELALQGTLAGQATTEVVVQDRAGRLVKVLHRWPGRTGSNVRTTINGGIQRAAQGALARLGLPAAIVAVRAGGGQILAVAQQGAVGLPPVDPLAGQYEPGQSFSFVSTAALLASGSVRASTLVPCYRTNGVGGQTFANVPPEPTSQARPFSAIFAHACATEFTALSLNLHASDLTRAIARFGLGASWQLPVPAFAGSMGSPGYPGQLAADMIGLGAVRVSPLDMALAAGTVASGSWHAPSLVSGSHGTDQTTAAPRYSGRVIAQLRQLMGLSVKTGAPKAAYLPGRDPLFGQVGSAPVAGQRGLRAIWFVGYRGQVAFAVLVFSRDPAFAPAVQLARQFAVQLPPGS